jgi:peptide-methionine (R)-S-oxide reductase
MRYLVLIVSLMLTQVLTAQEKSSMDEKIIKTESEWREILTPEQYYILRQKGTDRPGDGGYTNHFEKGTYHCAACDAQLFESGTKYESHCGWPSFDDAIDGAVEYKMDRSHGMIRTEIICSRCGGHLGHVFDDGPRDTTGKRYCVNTTSLRFVKS